MANLKEIRTRIASVESTMQITSAMKMVSAAKLKRAQDAITQMRPFAKKFNEILLNVSGSVEGGDHPLMKKNNGKKVLLIALSSNRGLCGGFNSNVIKEVKRVIQENPDKLFFTLANTVATIDFAKKFKGHGWMGIRFQTTPDEDYSEIILHIRFHHVEARLQQEVLGIMGVNLVYGAFFKNDDPKKILKYLYDHIDPDAIEIDTINFSGPLFKEVDNRLISLQLIRNGMTDAVMFDQHGKNILPARVLYKKNILAFRGSFRPVTKVNIDMYEKSLDIFSQEPTVNHDKTEVIFEITLSNLRAQGEIDETDFMDRAKLLCSLGHTVMISNFKEYYRLVDYFSHYTKEQVALAMGVNNFVEIFDEHYYQDLSGGILEAFGKMFYNNLKVYLYPMKNELTGELINSNNLKLHPRMKDFYKFFKYNGKVVDIFDFEPDYLEIFSRDILQRIKSNQPGWESQLPEGIAEMIQKEKMFGLNKAKKSVAK